MLSKSTSSISLAFRIWILTSLIFGTLWLCCCLLFGEVSYFWTCFIATVAAAIGSLPVLFITAFSLSRIRKSATGVLTKLLRLLLVCFVCTLPYSLLFGLILSMTVGVSDMLLSSTGASAVLFTCQFLAVLISRKQLSTYFSPAQQTLLPNQSKKMETTENYQSMNDGHHAIHSNANKTLIKGIITGVLILLLMIPTVYISELVKEREGRQKEIAREVSSRWASSQTLSGPYLFIPYKVYNQTKDGKTEETIKHLWALPEDLAVSGTVTHEIRRRSIYKVLLYRAGLTNSGYFKIEIPKDISSSDVQWADAKICFGLSDFKGIEERMSIQFNGKAYDLSPGLPSDDLSAKGLSAPVELTPSDPGARLSFNLQMKLKGSEELHFLPLSGNSSFALQSGWGNPSFDGNNLPSEREVSDTGFVAKWSFNKANLPFGTLLRDVKLDTEGLAFGVTLLQPADQYAKTARCVKYAILFIGLTFSLFFIIELMQKKPVHPVQYTLIGLALVIFYSLLLSISEFIFFDLSYLIASLATISLITAYARAHFGRWQSAGIFGGVLTALYGFIFVLIRLEDTALLVGSIGLFVVLALVMYASRKVNWYGSTVPNAELS